LSPLYHYAMELALGIVIGILLSIFLILIDIIFKRKVHTQGISGLIERSSKEKGSVVIPPSEEILNWQDRLKKNDKAGIDTLLTDL
jgi:MFS superfamily sulfate permease-like transporter